MINKIGCLYRVRTVEQLADFLDKMVASNNVYIQQEYQVDHLDVFSQAEKILLSRTDGYVLAGLCNNHTNYFMIFTRLSDIYQCESSRMLDYEIKEYNPSFCNKTLVYSEPPNIPIL